MKDGFNLVPVSALPSVMEQNTIYQVGTQLWMLGNGGNPVNIGSNPIVGQTTLVAGTKALAIAGTVTTSKAFLQLASPLTAGNTVDYQAVCTANTLTITALLAAKTINVADVSIINYMLFQ